MSKYQLSIVTINGQAFNDQVDSVIASGEAGSFGVLGKHAPMITALQSGPLAIKQDELETYYSVSSGILEVNDQNDCLVLVDYAKKVDSFEDAKHNSREE